MPSSKIICLVLASGLSSACAVAAVTAEKRMTDPSQDGDVRQFVPSFRGVVTKVTDGCTVEVEIKESRVGEIQGQKVEMPSSNADYIGTRVVKLVGTKCPPLGKRIGINAKDNLTQMTLGRLVEVIFKNYADVKHSQIVGQLVLAENGKDAGLEQLRTGMARFRDDKQKSISVPDRRKYKDAEKNAKKQKMGIWNDE